MKPLRFWMAVEPNGAPKRGGGGFVALCDSPEDARHGWALGFAKPVVVEVELRVVRRKERARGR